MRRNLTSALLAVTLVSMATTASAGSTAAEAAHDKVRALWGYSDPSARKPASAADEVTKATVGARGEPASIVRSSQKVQAASNVEPAGPERTGSSGSPASLVK